MARPVKRRTAAKRVAPPSRPAAQRAVSAARVGAIPVAQRAARVGAIDSLRAIALLMMFAYHFAFDLRFFGVLHADFENDPFWLGFRAIIVTSFMTLVGISIVLADRAGTTLPRFLRRVGLIALGALAATLASYVLFPASFIYFGILHSIAVTSLLVWPLRRAPLASLGIGIVILVAGLTLVSSWFDATYWSWIGFMTHKPITEDYVPLAPWASAAFIGVALGHWLVRTNFRLTMPLDAAPAWLRWMGRHSLLIYLLHQPLFMGLLWIVLAR